MKLYLLAIGNGSVFGSGMRVCPNAILDDSLLHCTLVRSMPFSRLLFKALPLLYRGTQFSNETSCIQDVSEIVTDQIKVTTLSSNAEDNTTHSEDAIYLEADGEFLGKLRATFGILSKRIPWMIWEEL